MRRLAQLRSWLRAILHRRDFERGMDEELRMHIACYEADLRSAGLSAAEAHRRARAEFGSREARKEECRDAFGLRLAGQLRADAAFALRLLRRSPAFTLVALLSLGLGIGANTAIFTLIDTVMVRGCVAYPEGCSSSTTPAASPRAAVRPTPASSCCANQTFFSGMAAFNWRSRSRLRSPICRAGSRQYFSALLDGSASAPSAAVATAATMPTEAGWRRGDSHVFWKGGSR